MPRARFGARWLLGNQQSLGGDALLKLGVLGWENDIDPAGDHCDSSACDAADMRGCIDAARQARHHCHILAAEFDGELAGETHGGGTGVARADHRHCHPPHQPGVATQHQCGRRVVQFGEEWRVIGIA
jgi:hypothetical protein